MSLPGLDLRLPGLLPGHDQGFCKGPLKLVKEGTVGRRGKQTRGRMVKEEEEEEDVRFRGNNFRITRKKGCQRMEEEEEDGKEDTPKGSSVQGVVRENRNL